MNNCKCGCLNIKVILEDEGVNIPIEIGNPIEHIVIPDVYEGSYDITPSTEEIILQTKDKTLTNDITVEPIPDEYIVPQGTKVIKEGGIYDIKQYETANVLTNIQSLSIMPSEQAQTFTLNNESISGYNPVVVNPIPSEYIIPTGVETINIIENGTISRDVKDKANVTVNVNIQNEDYNNALVAFGVESDLADGINALTTYSNSVTGEQDENLSDAVRTLADGYSRYTLADFTSGNLSGVFYDDTITELNCTFPPKSKVTEINLPNCKLISASSSIRVTTLKRLILPRLTGGQAYSVFESNNALEVLDVGNPTILSTLLRNLPALKVFVYRGNVTTNLSNNYNWCAGSSFYPSSGAEKCKIYVPQEYLQNYLNNAVWAGLNADFYPIEGSEYELQEIESKT